MDARLMYELGKQAASFLLPPAEDRLSRLKRDAAARAKKRKSRAQRQPAKPAKPAKPEMFVQPDAKQTPFRYGRKLRRTVNDSETD